MNLNFLDRLLQDRGHVRSLVFRTRSLDLVRRSALRLPSVRGETNSYRLKEASDAYRIARTGKRVFAVGRCQTLV
jgi:hypothetical protein